MKFKLGDDKLLIYIYILKTLPKATLSQHTHTQTHTCS